MADETSSASQRRASASGYWVRTRRLALVLTLVWAVAALALPLAAVPLEAVAVLGIPFGYYLGSQGAMILVAFLLLLAVLRQDRIDREAGISE